MHNADLSKEDEPKEPSEFERLRDAVAQGRNVIFPDVTVSQCQIHGRPFTFATSMRRDPAQRALRNGGFYEAPELNDIRGQFPLGGTFVDIGANVGNHSLFVAGFLAPTRIIPFEPSPIVGRLLLANISLNGFAPVFDLSFLGLGLSDCDGGGFAIEERDHNLGAAKMIEGAGDLRVIRGDDALKAVDPSFIKIDVEGMELKVLSGLSATIDRARPSMLVEVDNSNFEEFQDWLVDTRYKVIRTRQRYPDNKNHLIRPRRRGGKQ